MADPPLNRPGQTSPARDADRREQAILGVLLLAHPAQRSTDEVVREMTDDPEDFAARDDVENALRDLVRAGLVHRHGPFVFATAAAVRFHELWA
jgi:hypothetical protein